MRVKEFNPEIFSPKKILVLCILTFLPGFIYSFMFQHFWMWAEYIFYTTFAFTCVYIFSYPLAKFRLNRYLKKKILRLSGEKGTITMEQLNKILPLDIWQGNFNEEIDLYVNRYIESLSLCYYVSFSIGWALLTGLQYVNINFIAFWTIFFFLWSPVLILPIRISSWTKEDALRRAEEENYDHLKKNLKIRGVVALIITFLPSINYYGYILEYPNQLFYLFAILLLNLSLFSFSFLLYFNAYHPKKINKLRNAIFRNLFSHQRPQPTVSIELENKWRLNPISYIQDYIFLTSWHGEIRICEKNTGKVINTFRAHEKPINTVFFSPGHNFLITAAESLKIWDFTSSNLIREINIPQKRLVNLLLSKNEDLIIGHFLNGLIMLWDLETGSEIGNFNQIIDEKRFRIELSDDGEYFILYSYNNIKIWNFAEMIRPLIMRYIEDTMIKFRQVDLNKIYYPEEERININKRLTSVRNKFKEKIRKWNEYYGFREIKTLMKDQNFFA